MRSTLFVKSLIAPVIVEYLLISAVSFSMGLLAGWGWAKRAADLTETRLRRSMALVLLGVYVVSVIAEIALNGYSTPILLHATIGGIVGFLFSQGNNITFNLGW